VSAVDGAPAIPPRQDVESVPDAVDGARGICRRNLGHEGEQISGCALRPAAAEHADGRTITWAARDPKRVRPLSGTSCNRLVSVLRRADRLGQEKLSLPYRRAKGW
jgi:hypothetical protein